MSSTQEGCNIKLFYGRN